MQPSTKAFIVNTATVALIVAVLVVGYIVFTKNKAAVTEVVAPSESIDKTIMMGVEMNKTFKDLSELKAAVEDARAMIGSPVFLTLKDLSAVIPTESIGRDNPFIPASWKAAKK